jgi:hypothetical protein
METTESIQNPAICPGCDATLNVPADPRWVTRLRVWPEANLGLQVPFLLCQGCDQKLVDLLRQDDLSEATAFAVKCHCNERSCLAWLPAAITAALTAKAP